MSFVISRRRLVQATSSAIAAGALSRSGLASAQPTGELRVATSGGNWGDAIVNAFVKPFEAETGIKVTPIFQDVGVAQIGMMVKTNTVSIDVTNVGQILAETLSAGEFLEKIDYSHYDKSDLDAVPAYCRHSFGFACFIYSLNMFFNTGKFPNAKQRPATWAEFWDVKNFPGTRSLMTGASTPGPFEEALLADGVPMDAIYPMDIDRIFASLDKIKPHIRKWWASGAEILQVMRDNVADLGQSYDGRINSLIDAGAPIDIGRNQVKLTWDYWVIPKGSPNAQNAQKFIASTARADRQAEFARLFAQSPTNRNAFKYIPENISRKLATNPDYAAGSFPTNAKWYVEVGSDGLSNRERLSQRWKQWIVL
ncbi:ABC transporter substrate-binding protein [Bradyrhizobium ottawaense]|uniref:ABC transporter substrate-binding protein n=1 Tax=Bradyrhizobium ottawaense TaxID=931866 RepID=UPI003FA00667